MITLTTSGDSVVFNFDNNGHYLQEGTIEVPKNSLSLVIDSSDMVTFKKAASNDVFVSATLAELGMTKEQVISFYEENMVAPQGGGGGGVDVVQTTGTSTADVMSQDAVTTALNGKANKTDAFGGYQFGSSSDSDYIHYKNVDNTNIGNSIYYPKINGKGILTSNQIYARNNYNFSLVETSAITSAVTSASTDSEVPSAKAVYDAIPQGGGGMSEDTERLIATSLVDLNDRKIDASEVKANYQKKGDYATKSEVALKANASDVMTLEKSKENELVTASALNSINERLIALEEAVQALQRLHN